MDNVQYCRAEAFGTCVIGTFRVPDKKQVLEKRYAIGYYFERERLIFIDNQNIVKKILERMEDIPFEKDAGVVTMFAFFLDNLVRDDVVNLQELEESMGQLEEELLTQIPRDFYQTIITYRKKLLILHSYYEQMTDLGDVLTDAGHLFKKSEQQAFEHFTNRCNRLHDHVEMLREYMIQIREMYQSQLESSQNRSMNLLTLVTTVFFPLSLMAGWYGMNFTGMPELTWKYGYTTMILLSATIVTLEILYFKKKKML